MKAAKTYGDAQLPIFLLDDGSYMSQSQAILKSLAVEHGYACENAAVTYETEWFFSMLQDVFESPDRFAIMRDNATEEEQDKCIAVLESTLDKLEARWSDDRTSVGKSEGKTAADFYMLGIITSHYENANGKHEKIRNAAAAKLAACPNVQRVIAPMKELCRATIEAIPASSI